MAPAFAPDAIASEPGTYVTPAGSGSVRTVLIDVSLPVFTTLIAYSSTSPATIEPPFTSVTDFVDVLKSGRNVEMLVIHPPR